MTIPRSTMRVRWLLALLPLAACAPWLPQASAADTTIAGEHRPGTTYDDLRQGRSLYARRCANCHSLKDPSSVPAHDWPAKITKMQAEHDVKLASNEADLIGTYLYTMSRRATASRQQ